MNAMPFAQRISDHRLRVMIDPCALRNEFFSLCFFAPFFFASLGLCVRFLWMFILAAGTLLVAGSARVVRFRNGSPFAGPNLN